MRDGRGTQQAIADSTDVDCLHYNPVGCKHFLLFDNYTKKMLEADMPKLKKKIIFLLKY